MAKPVTRSVCTLGVGHGPNSSRSAPSAAVAARRRLRSVRSGAATESSAAASLRGRLEASDGAAACPEVAAMAAVGGAGVVGAAEERLRFWREGSLRMNSSILRER